MPFCQKLGRSDKKEGNIRNKSRNRYCLNTQADRVYIQKGRDLGSLINKDTMKEEIDSAAELDKIDNNSGDENPYRRINSH